MASGEIRKIGADATPPAEALGTVHVAPEGAVEVFGPASIEGLSGAGTVVGGGRGKATLILNGDSGVSTFSGAVSNGPDGAPLAVHKTGQSRAVLSNTPSTAASE